MVGVARVALLDAHEEPGQLGLIEVELSNQVGPLEEEKGKAGEWTTAAGLFQLEGIKLPFINLCQEMRKLLKGGMSEDIIFEYARRRSRQ